MQLWVWRHFRLELPDDWEMLQVSRRLPEGRCLFADRESYRLEWSWRQVPGPPDMERMLRDYMSNLTAKQGVTKLREVSAPGWRGLAGMVDDLLTCRYGRYFAAEGCLVEMVFLWTGKRDAKLEKQVLASVAEEPVVDGRRRWRGFGLACWPDERLHLEACEVKPAHVRLSFEESERSPRTLQVERLGMVDEWLKVGVAEWLGGRLPKGARGAESGRTERHGHEVALSWASLTSRVPFTARWVYQAAAWICPRDGRLYSVSCLMPAEEVRGRPEDLVGSRLCCCVDICASD